jgi:hypothetical protein
LLAPVKKTHHIAYRHGVSAQSLFGLLPYFDIGTVEVDCRIGNQPPLLRRLIENDCLLAAKLEKLAALGSIGLRIEVIDGLTNPEARLHGCHPSRLIKNAINGCPQTIQVKCGGLGKTGNGFRIVHSVKNRGPTVILQQRQKQRTKGNSGPER